MVEFIMYDKNFTGSIDIDELLTFGESIGAGWTRKACESLMTRMDANNDACARPRFAHGTPPARTKDTHPHTHPHPHTHRLIKRLMVSK